MHSWKGIIAVATLAGCGVGDGAPGDDAAGTGGDEDLAMDSPADLYGVDLRGRDLKPPPKDLKPGGKADFANQPAPDLWGANPDLAGTSSCTDDSQCNPPSTLCEAGTCVKSCVQNPSLCTMAQMCDQTTGRCTLKMGACADDMDCGDKEYCTSSFKCMALPAPDPVSSRCPPKGGTAVSSPCNMKATPAGLASCAGPAAASGCPYCRDKSCYWPLSWTGAACKSDGDCHGGDHCDPKGVCVVDAKNPCPKTVTIKDILAGRYGSGKEVCIKDVVQDVTNETDGDHHVRMGNVQYPNRSFTGFVTEPTPQYTGQGLLGLPAKGQTVRLHGMVRWDEGHAWWEIHPVDWIGP